MKKLSLLLLSVLFIFSLVGCGSADSVKDSTANSNTVSEESVTPAVEPSSSEPDSTAPETSETTPTETKPETKEPSILPQPIIINTTKLESNSLVFDLSWDGSSVGTQYDLDLIGFMLDGDGDCYDSNGFVFYNNAISPDNSMKLSADVQGENGLSETMTIDLSLVSPDTQRIAIWVCRFYEDDYDMSELDAAVLKIKNGETDLNGCSISEGVSYEVCELVRKEDGWYIQDMNLVSEYNLKDICISYGLSVN